MIKVTKTTLAIMMAGILFASVAVVGCDGANSDKTVTVDSPAVTPSMEVAPPAGDTTTKKGTAKTRPVSGG